MKTCQHCGSEYKRRPWGLVPFGTPPGTYERHCSLACWRADSRKAA